MNTTICMEIGKLQIGPLTGIRENACFPRLRFFPRISRTSITMAFTSLSWRLRERCFKVVNVREGLACIVMSPLFRRTKCRLVFYSEFNIFPALYYGDSAEKENEGKNGKKKTKQEWIFLTWKQTATLSCMMAVLGCLPTNITFTSTVRTKEYLIISPFIFLLITFYRNPFWGLLGD